MGRLARQRKAWIIVVGILVTPALYAWFNINAFWDPYSNTSNITVAVVNLDEGAESDLTGPLDVGAQVVDELQSNDQLGWEFLSEDEAQDAVRSGRAYAAIVIPADFSADLISITTGEFTQPALQYYVNEKASAIAPKITDVGASTLDKQITSAFTEQVAASVTDAVKDAGDDLELHLLNEKSNTLDAFDTATQSITTARQNLSDLSGGLSSSRDAISSAKGTLDDVDATLADVQSGIAQAQAIIAEAQTQVIAFTDAATSAYVDGATHLADASAAANVAVTQVTQALDSAGARIDGAIDDVTAVVQSNEAALEQLQQLVDAGGLDPDVHQRLTDAITALQERNASDQQLLAQLQTLNTQAGEAVNTLQASADALDAAVQNAQTAATDLRTVLTSSVPALSRAMAELSTSAGAFSAAIDAQRAQLDPAQQLLTGLDGQLASTIDAVGSLDANLSGILDSLAGARTDVIALSAASAWETLGTITGLNAQQIAQFVASPVEVSENVLFPIDTYGSAMAALFTNLSLWIGAFVLMVIFKIEVDTEGLEGITVREAYVGRFMLFAAFAVAQALIVSIGNLIIGVQTVSAVAFVGTAVLISLAYMSIVYALCVAFGHVGRGLCILLVIMQIPGASGLYPIEMMPGFFRAIYPFLPFTYGIDAMRETIAGFYGSHYWQFLGMLSIFVVLAWVLGLVLRSRLANLNLVFNREIAATDLLIGEKVQVVGSGYRLSDVFHALSDRREYRDDLARRAAPFLHRYPTLLKIAALTGAGGLAVLGVVAWLIPGGKATLLGIWVLWILIVIGFLVSLEYIKQSFELAAEVGTLDDEHLRQQALADGPRGRGGAVALATATRVEADAPVEHVLAVDTAPVFAADVDPEDIPTTDAPPDDLDEVIELFGEEPGDGAPDAPAAGDAPAAPAADAPPATDAPVPPAADAAPEAPAAPAADAPPATDAPVQPAADAAPEAPAAPDTADAPEGGDRA
ncbi:MAG: hypothetical protein ABS62_04960 [Microbacterium sp. SCN 70-200]|nr:MAG: hypothetical protein ABS62_04960 [Microbacterium sp. SCN 70-200]OJV84504.1 MAG: hypothetical protein BGO46_06205 [Microbacterium sp. 70-16]